MTAEHRQGATRNAIRGAVRRYAAERTTLGVQSDTVPVTLADGTPAVALIVVDLVLDPRQQEPKP